MRIGLTRCLGASLCLLDSAGATALAGHLPSKWTKTDSRKKNSAEWRLKAVDVCWKQKEQRIRNEEEQAAAGGDEVAREAYGRIAAKCVLR